MATKQKRPAAPPPAAPTVDDLMRGLDHPLKAEIAAVRDIVMASHPQVREGIKWNAPSFAVADYFATINLRRRDAVMVVLHRGAKVRPADAFGDGFPDPARLLAWLSHDRAVVTLRDMADVLARREALSGVIHAWVERL